MTDHIDHAAEAARLLREAQPEWNALHANYAAAQAHAVLALVGAYAGANANAEVHLALPARYEIRWCDEAEGLALYCPECDERVCDVEHGDTLGSLIGVANDHECDTTNGVTH